MLVLKADRDLASADLLLAGSFTDTASFHLQQAVEKYLKAYLDTRQVT